MKSNLRLAVVPLMLGLAACAAEYSKSEAPDTLRVRFEIDESLLAQELPPVLLLPLAERAIREGRGTAAQPFEILVTVQRLPDDLVLLEVANTGRLGHSRAPMPAATEREAPDVRASLERHYPGRYRFALSQDSLMARATVCVPLRA